MFTKTSTILNKITNNQILKALYNLPVLITMSIISIFIFIPNFGFTSNNICKDALGKISSYLDYKDSAFNYLLRFSNLEPNTLNLIAKKIVINNFLISKKEINQFLDKHFSVIDKESKKKLYFYLYKFSKMPIQKMLTEKYISLESKPNIYYKDIRKFNKTILKIINQLEIDLNQSHNLKLTYKIHNNTIEIKRFLARISDFDLISSTYEFNFPENKISTTYKHNFYLFTLTLISFFIVQIIKGNINIFKFNDTYQSLALSFYVSIALSIIIYESYKYWEIQDIQKKLTFAIYKVKKIDNKAKKLIQKQIALD